MEKKTFSVTITKELEDELYALRALPEYQRMTLSEIVRTLVKKGLDISERENKTA